MRRTWLAVVVLAGVITISGGVFFIIQRNTTTKPTVMQQAADRATFPLYTPSSLPEGYTLDQASLSLTKEALLVTARNQNGERIIFTEQPVPTEFDFESFYKKQFVGAQDVTSIYGRGQAGILDSTMSGSLVTDSTWVIIKGPPNLPLKDMETVVGGLKPVLSQ